MPAVRRVRPYLLTQSRAMRPVLRLIEQSAPSHANVLIGGEPGTGKSLVARALHEGSPRASRPLLIVNAGGQPDDALEIGLFGAADLPAGEGIADRAGTYELAGGGTLLLDEVGNLPAAIQGRLLAALESGAFHRVGASLARRADVRVLSVTTGSLAAEAAGGRFLPELLMRLATIEIVIPPLRQRPEDIPLLADAFLEELAAAHGRTAPELDDGARAAMIRHPWPGNVRELRHTIASAVRVARKPVLTARDLGLRAWGERSPRLDDVTLAEAEAVLIRRALARANGNWRWAAAALGLSTFDFRQRVRRHGLA